jgi:thiamine biosynthesis lipoprotein
MQQPGRRRFLVLAAGSLAGAAAGGTWHFGRIPAGGSTAPADPDWPLTTQRSKALGTDVSISVRHWSQKTAQEAITAAFAELELVEALMSIYRPDSQISRLNREGCLDRPHRHVVNVLRQAQAMAEATDGAFDVTVQPLWEAFAAAAKQQRLPDEATVVAARALVDWRQLDITPACVRLMQAGMRVTLNGIAQGFAADRVMAALKQRGVEHALVDTGELGTVGRSSRDRAWCVGIQHPREDDAYVALADLDGRALSTSGDYATRFSADGRHHHIFDPRTGYSPAEAASVSVVAPTATGADVLSTALLVLGPEQGLRLLGRDSQFDALFVQKNGQTITTPGFPLSKGGPA